MMDRNELRPGNTIRIICMDMMDWPAPKDRIANIYSIEGDGFRCKDKPGFWHIYQSAHAIPLTEKWLRQMGFMDTSIPAFQPSELYHPMFPLIYHAGQWRWNSAPFLGSGSPACVPTIEYVHQLQNLYFALTGEELTIK